MSKFEKIKTMLSELLNLEMASATSDKGVIYFDGDELAEGVAVYIEDEEGNRVPAEDGVYEVEMKLVEIKDGKVVSIEDKQEGDTQEPAEEDENVDENVETEEVENPTNEGEETTTEGIVELRKEVNELYAIVDALRKEIEELKAKPVAMSATEELENIKKEDGKLKGAARYTQYLKK